MARSRFASTTVTPPTWRSASTIPWSARKPWARWIGARRAHRLVLGGRQITAGALSDRVVGGDDRQSKLRHGTGAYALSSRLCFCMARAIRRCPTLAPRRSTGVPAIRRSWRPLANHGLDEVRDRMRDRLIEWLLRILPSRRRPMRNANICRFCGREIQANPYLATPIRARAGHPGPGYALGRDPAR